MQNINLYVLIQVKLQIIIVLQKNMLDFYYYILDKKIQNWSLLILIIAILIISAWIIFGSGKVNTNASIINYKKFIKIDWKDYKVKFEELKK